MKFAYLGAVLLATMICGQAWAGESSAISAKTATSAVKTGAAKSEVRIWLEKAEAAAAKIEDTKKRETQIEYMVLDCCELHEIDMAHAFEAKLGKELRNEVGLFFVSTLAWHGQPDEAIYEAEMRNNPAAWPVLCCSFANQKDIPRALSLLDKVSEDRRAGVLVCILENQVCLGDQAGAETTAAKLPKIQDLQEQAAKWLAAGRVFQGDKEAKFAPQEMESQLSQIADARVKAGDIKAAERALGLLKDHFLRSQLYAVLAEHHLKFKKKNEFQRAIEESFKEASSIGDPEHNGWGNIQSASAFLTIANLQVKAGQFDAALKTIGLADQAGKEDSKKWQELGVKSGGIFKALGGRKTLIGLLILAGNVDEAVKAATQEDGRLMPEAVRMLAEAFAAHGQAKELAALMESAKSPESECDLCRSAARGVAKKAGVIPMDESWK